MTGTLSCPSNSYVGALAPAPQDVRIWRWGFGELIKVDEVTSVALMQSDQGPHERRRSGHTHTQRETV